VLSVKRVLPSYVQVADQLRDAILRDEVPTGDRLPNEAALAQLFGVGRSTVREAVRVLTSEGLLVSRRGANGGTFIVRPDTGQVEDWLGVSLGRLATANKLALSEIVEAWELLEVPAAELAARRRTDGQAKELERLSLVGGLADDGASLREATGRFHSVIFESSGNRLLPAISRPVSSASRMLFDQKKPTDEFWMQTQAEHRDIARAVRARDERTARDAMLHHIRALVSWYLPARTRRKATR
jgi:DNA-binding FadR family transcriptional regulator